MSNAWVVPSAWFGIYLAGSLLVPTRKLGRGLFTRHVLARIPPKFMWTPWGRASQTRYMMWFLTSIALQEAGVIPKGKHSYPEWAAVFYIPIIAMLLDDYLFGDDDETKRRWEGAKNKIRWLMELPPAPEPEQVRS